MKKEKRKSTRWLMGGLAALTLLSMGSMVAAQTVTSYNDLAWGTGQLETNITKITSPNGGSGLPDSGALVDFATGNPTSVILTVTGGDFIGDVQAAQGANPTTGSDAFDIFDGKVNAQGAVSYIDASGSNLVLTFTGMNENSTYDLTFFSDRGANGWDRASLVTLSTGMGGDRVNISSVASDNPDGGVIFSGPLDGSTRLPSDNSNGYVARWNGIKSGSDGMVMLTISFDGSAGQQFKGKYASAIRLIATGSAGSGENISKLGDLDGDGKDDIVWRHTNGDVAGWLGNGLTLGSTAIIASAVDSAWTRKGVGDLDGDGKGDLVWRHTNGDVAVWLGNGLTLGSTGMLASAVDAAWAIKGVGDLSGDGKDDLVWHHTNGDVAVWLGNGLTLGSTGLLASAVDAAWAIKGVGDLSGDGKDDLVWRHTNGDVAVWLGNGLTLGSAGVLASMLSSDWQINP